MTGTALLRTLALALPQSSEEPHFDKTSFRVAGKIFATCDAAGRATLRLRPADQDVFGTFDASAVFPVPNKWGQQGWTCVLPEKLPASLLGAMLRCAWLAAAPRKLHPLLPPETD